MVGERDADLFASSGGAAHVDHVKDGVMTYQQTLLPPESDGNPNWLFGQDVDVVCGWPVEVIGVAFSPAPPPAVRTSTSGEREEPGS